MNANADLFRCGELQDELVASDAYKLIQRLRTFDPSLHIFRRNFNAVENAIQSHLPTTMQEMVRLAQNHEARNEDQIEIVRHLHNFVASALSLVDHTRVFYRELYEDKNLIAGYQDEIESRFVKHGLSNFVKGLRQYTQHYRLPTVATSLSMDIEQQTMKCGVSLRRDELLAFTSWSHAAKDFLGGCSESIELLDVLTQYRDHVNAFDAWFRGEQSVVHREDFEYHDKTMAEMKRLRAAVRVEHIKD